MNRVDGNNHFKASKRAGDILIAAFAILLLAPLMLTIAAAVAVAYGRPILRRSRIPGVQNTVLRFRVAAANGHASGVGRILYRCRADELPVLFAVVRGRVPLRPCLGVTNRRGTTTPLPDAA